MICDQNKHGDRCCWHWVDGPPDHTVPGMPAYCCWCAFTVVFSYADILEGTIGVTNGASVHGQRQPRPVTLAWGRHSVKGAVRDHMRKMASVAQPGIERCPTCGHSRHDRNGYCPVTACPCGVLIDQHPRPDGAGA